MTDIKYQIWKHRVIRSQVYSLPTVNEQSSTKLSNQRCPGVPSRKPTRISNTFTVSRESRNTDTCTVEMKLSNRLYCQFRRDFSLKTFPESMMSRSVVQQRKETALSAINSVMIRSRETTKLPRNVLHGFTRSLTLFQPFYNCSL